ncbi:MAG: NADPH:quinone reductase [Pirellulaceae bacterium]|jgi:NADPH2:quinone reductase|nr:NADPH:quinone reductase [Pirellulaceae bacterium]MDP7018407.1 NADPH:quinone reductase [Pirellulaceae bacterium]
MHAAYIESTGPAENIKYGELPDPQPSGSQVLVQVGAVAVNPVDTYIRNGANYWDLPNPFIVGCDLAGVVVDRGPEAKRFQVGDRVWGTNQGLMGRQGTFAELCAVDEDWLYPTPAGVGDEDAAACALVGVTAHLGLFQCAQLKSGESLFVQGGAGGVGSMVLQMGRAVGARVIATAGSDEKVAACEALGAVGVHYRTDNVAAAVAEFAPDGVDVFWETQREPDFDAIVGGLADRGRIVLMAGREARPEFPVGPFYVKGCSLHGFVMFKQSPDELRRCADDINRWLAAGELQARIGCRLSLSEAAQAHRLQEDNTLAKAGTLMGKIVLKP